MYRQLHKKLLIFVVVAIFFLPISFAYEEGIHLIRPYSSYLSESTLEYLSVEDVVFVSCLEEDIPITNSVTCLDSNDFIDLEPVKWGEDNCYLSTFSLSSFPCKTVRIQAEYLKDGETQRMYKTFRVNKFSSLLDSIVETQYTDGGWRTARDSAYGIWALSNFPNLFSYEIEKALDWITLKRNEEFKCWPKSPCHMPSTMEILFLLSESGFDDARRAVNDARNWIETEQNYYDQGDYWSVFVKPLKENSSIVLVATDRNVIDENFTLPDSGKKFSFQTYLNTTLYVIGFENFEAVVQNRDGDTILEYQGSNLSYSIPGSCWSNNKLGEPCDSYTTAFASSLDLHERNLRESRRWMFYNTSVSSDVGVFYGEEDNILLSALFLKAFKDDIGEKHMADYSPYMDRWDYLSLSDQYSRYLEEVEKLILFKQNNEGSWGIFNDSIEKKAVPTAYSVLALSSAGYNRTSEPIEDAEWWLSSHEEEINKNDTVALSSAFYVLRNNARPLLSVNPGYLILNKQSFSFELFNPTPFDLMDLSYNFTDGLEDYIDIVEKNEISSYSYRKISGSIIKNPSSEIYGFLELYNLDEQIIRIPVVITDTPTLNFSFPSLVTIFGKSGFAILDAVKSNHEFICSVSWDSDDLESSGTFKVSSAKVKLPLNFVYAETKQDSYDGTLSCEARGNSYEFPISIYVERYMSNPISVSPDILELNSTNGFVSLRNNLDVEITVDVYSDSSFIEFSDSVNLRPLEVVNLTIVNLISGESNTSESTNIRFSSLGRTETVKAIVSSYEQKSSILKLFFLFLFIIFLAVGGFFAYKYKDNILEFYQKFNPRAKKTELSKNIANLVKIKNDERSLAIVNMYNILKFQSSSDKDIKARLLEMFSKEDVINALKEANIVLSNLEEEEPENLTK